MVQRGFVRTHLRGDDRARERDPDRVDRGVDQVPVGVREHHELPTAPVRLAELLTDLRKHRPARQRASERVALGGRQVVAVRRRKLREDDGQHLAIARARPGGLDLRLDLVELLEQPVALAGVEHPLELCADAGSPVDERPVAVERRPARVVDRCRFRGHARRIRRADSRQPLSCAAPTR
jgi:hypothetical protein